jgi:hypothetical protein
MMKLNVFALAGAAADPFVHARHLVEFVECAGLYAAVERIATAPVVSEAALRTQHDIVAAIASRIDAVLPARFGSVLDEDELRHLVARAPETFATALDLVRGRTQMTVRLLGAEPRLTTGRSLPGRPAAVSGTAYLEQRRSAATIVVPPEVAVISTAVRGVVAAERVEAGQGRVAATVYHLVDRGAIGAYEQAIEAIPSPLGQKTMTVTGPWPPFAFVPEVWR